MFKLAKVPIDLILYVVYQITRAFVLWYESCHVINRSEE